MKLVTFTHRDNTRVGVAADRGIVDLSVAAPELPRDMKSLLAAGKRAWQRARSVSDTARAFLPLAEVRFEAPIPNPSKILAIGLKYADHVAESRAEAPKHQIWFNKQANTVVGPVDPIIIPAVAHPSRTYLETCQWL